MNMLISKENFARNSYWLDDCTFYVAIPFKEFPTELLKKYSDLITNDDIETGYLSCEYWLPDDDCAYDRFVYNFNFDYDVVSVNEYFNKNLYNDMIKEIAGNT